MKRLFSILLVVFVCVLKENAQGDGPRGYWPQPTGTNLVTPLYTYIGTNQVFDNSLIVNDAEFNTNIYGLMYSSVFPLMNRTAGVVALLNYGDTTGGIPGFAEGSASGFGDLYVIGVVNLYGAPSVTKEEYVKTSYNYSANLLVAFKATTGKYNPDRALNLGTNRWEFKIGAPLMKFFNWGTPKVTSLELLPTLSFFTENSEPGGNGNALTQKPLFGLEAHVTQQLNRMIWLSLDSMYRAGGETSLDGLANDNALNSFQLGGTFGAYFSSALGIKLTYGSVIGDSSNSLTGNMFRAMVTYIF